MAVRRIVANVAAEEVERARPFYEGALGLGLVMNLGWIATYAGSGLGAPQLSVMSEGGSGRPVPDISVEVDDLDGVHERVVAKGFAVEYGPVREPWGVRRFHVRDPFGRLINVLAHD